MDMSGEYVIAAPRQVVWEALNNPDLLKQCIPGCESIAKNSETAFEAKVTAKVGPVRAKFAGKVTLSEIDPPNGYTISGEGSGGPAGFAKGGAKVELSDVSEGTKLSYSVDATVGGKLAQIGSRLIDSTAKKMANDFFGKFAEIVANEGDGSDTVPPETNAQTDNNEISSKSSNPSPEQQTMPDNTSKSLSPAVWIIGVSVTILAIIFLFQG